MEISSGDLKKLDKYTAQHSKTIIQNIQQLYKARELTQTEFGALMGFTQGKVSHVERGRNELTGEYIIKAAKVLGVGICDICIDKVMTDKQASILLKVREAIQSDDPAIDYIDKILSDK